MLRQSKNSVSVSMKISAFAGALLLLAAAPVTGCVDGDNAGVSMDESPDVGPPSSPLVWTDYFSEEDPPGVCSGTRLMRGFECEGSYCDDLRIDCSLISVGDQLDSSWSDYFSEEGSYPEDAGICPPGSWVTGIDCSGSYCDNVSIRCTEVVYPANHSIYSTAIDCAWSDWRSEEDPAWYTGSTNRFVNRVQCSGSNCDEMRFHVCTLAFPIHL